MPSKRLITIAFMFISSFICVNLSYGQTYWNKTYGHASGYVLAIQSTVDGNFLAVGSSGSGEGLVMKIKPNGDSIWTKTYGQNSPYNWFTAIQPTRDGNFLILGNTNAACLLKINQNGDTLWTKIYDSCTINAIYASDDGNFLLAGSKNFLNAASNDLIIKIKPDGTIIWSKSYCINNQAGFYSIRPSGDGNFLLAGYADFNSDESGFNGWLVKITADGDSIWSKKYQKTSTSYFNSIQPLSDGNFMLTGSTLHSRCEIDRDAWILKIRPNGDTIWSRNYDVNSDDIFYAIQPTSDNNYILAGDTWSGDTVRGLLMKIKPNGDSIWSSTFGKTIATDFRNIKPTCDGNFLVTGYGSISILSIINDQYANKNQKLTYKIPVYCDDTLNFGYTPLKVPSGMTVSAGGTISWTPNTDSIYMAHAEFLVFNDTGRKDTLTFNIFVNYDHKTQNVVKPQPAMNSKKPFDITVTSTPGYVRFNLPPNTGTLCIYDIRGSIIDKITPVRSSSAICINWPGNQSIRSAILPGKYLVKTTAGNESIAKLFVVMK
jgi:hypothetical protein